MFDYWRGKQLYDRMVEVLPAETLRAVDEGLVFHYYLNRAIGHITVDYEQVLQKGMAGLKAEVEAELARQAADLFLQAFGNHPGLCHRH